MPWKETSPMNERMAFLVDYQANLFSMSFLAERYGVSRKTLYKWVLRYGTEGAGSLRKRSSRPLRSPNQTPAAMERRLVEFRIKHTTWGAKKIVDVLQKREPRTLLPARSTVSAILKRNGLVKGPRGRRREGHPGKPMTKPQAPNELWAADFKGQFRTGDSIYCYPLTVTDLHSRFLLGCQSLLSTNVDDSMKVFERLFREYGLPDAIRTDNGVPFASTGLCRLTRLSVWWIKLGIRPELTQPAHPDQNGSHERMHRTLKAETVRPPADSLRAQQRRFDRFRLEFNQERPHEAIGMKRPAELYVPSRRPYPSRIPRTEYPGHFEVRLVSRNGGVRWKNGWLNVSHPLIGELIGLEEVDDSIWNVYFATFLLGRFHERDRKLYGAFYTHRPGQRYGKRGDRRLPRQPRLPYRDHLVSHSDTTRLND